MMDHALQYLKQGFSVVPAIMGEKRTYIAWGEFQKRLPTEAEVNQWWTKWPKANIAIVTGLVSGLAVIDIDSPEGKKELNDLIPDSCFFPIADSPSGGEHWYFKCLDSDLQTKAGLEGFTKVDIRANGGIIMAPPSIKGDGRAYRWRKGFEINRVAIPVIPASLYERLPKKGKQPDIALKSSGAMFTQGTRDKDLFYVACSLLRGKMPIERIYETLMAIAMSCNPPFSLKEAEAKVKSAMKTAAELPRDLKNEVAQWCAIQDGAFRLDQCMNELALQTIEQKADCRQIVMDLSKRGFVERERGIGCYRLVNKNIEFIKIPDGKPEPLNIKWPFGIERWVDIYPGNLAIVAGTSNAGKSAFCLNFAKSNIDIMPVRYQSSEMDGYELKARLDGFGLSHKDFSDRIEWIKRSADWWDLILPDAINIIDFMEIYSDFYKVGEWIKKVFDKLQGGIALIALQKKGGDTEDARGGAFTREKARLYLSMDYGRLKIVKGKNWHTPEDPNGLFCEFTMERGVILRQTTGWEYETEK